MAANDYIIIIERTPSLLMDKVRKQMENKKWTPLGGPFIWPDPNGAPQLAQAMIDSAK